MTDETDPAAMQHDASDDDQSGGPDGGPSGAESPAMAQLMTDMETALGGLAASQQEAASQVPKIREHHAKLEQQLADAYQAEDFTRYNELADEITALERIWQMTLHTVGPNPAEFGLPEHPTLVDPDE